MPVESPVDTFTTQQALIRHATAALRQKRAFQPAPPPADPAAGGAPPPMDPAAAGMAPPPMDPAAGMAPPAGDPAAGGAPPMDPAITAANLAGMPVDPSTVVNPPADPAAGGGGGKGGGKVNEAALAQLNARLFNIEKMLARVMEEQGKTISPEDTIIPLTGIPGNEKLAAARPVGAQLEPIAQALLQAVQELRGSLGS